MRLWWLGAVVALPATAQAASDETMHLAFQRAIAIVETHSGYRDIPPVRYWVKVPVHDMARMAVRNEAAGDPGLVVAMFVCAERAMYLSETLDPDDPEQLSVVVHEMVHHAQCEAGRFTRDICQAEREAYRIQAAYHRSLADRFTSGGGDTAPGGAEADDLAFAAAGDAACRAARNR